MKGFHLHKWMGILPRFFLLFGLLMLTIQATASTRSILIIKSSENSFFNTSIEQLINQTRPPVKFRITTLESLKKDPSLLDQPSLIITLGLDSASYSSELDHSIPVIHSYITEFQFLSHKKFKNHYSILLDQPLQRYLAFIKLLLGADKIAIIKNKNNLISPETLKQVSSTLGIQLEQRPFETGDNPVNMVRDLLQRNDALLTLPDAEVYNRNYLKGILLTSYRQNKPVISYSPAQVYSGALAAIFSSPENIGNQIADLLNKLLENREFTPLNHYFAAEFDIKINQRVAKSLGLTLPDKEELLRELKQRQDQ